MIKKNVEDGKNIYLILLEFRKIIRYYDKNYKIMQQKNTSRSKKHK